MHKSKTPQDAAFDPSRLRWDDLELLLALSRTGTLSGAAVRLGVNTSTIARRLDAMERAHGIHLFDRMPTGIAPTEMAEALLPVAETMERAAADALRVLEGRETEPEGLVRLTAPPGVANWFVAPALVHLRARHPKLVVELQAEVGYADLTRREADVALRGRRPRTGDLVATRLVQAESVVVAAPSLVDRLEGPCSVDALDWITWGPDLAHLPDARWIATQVPAERIVLRTSSMDAQLHAARAGLGAMLLSRPFLQWTGLVEVPVSSGAHDSKAMPTGALWIVGHRALRNVPRVQALWDFIVDQASTWS